MATYRVRAVSKPFGGLAAGSLVELTVQEAASFADKVEAVEPPAPDAARRRKSSKAEAQQ